MTGAEIFIAIIGILAGFAQCSQYATQVLEKLKQKRTFTRAVTQAERLSHSLKGGGSAIKDELYNLKRSNGIIGLGAGSSRLSLVEAQSEINSLQSLLHQLVSQKDFIFTPDFPKYQTMADRSRNLTLESLHQLMGHLITVASITSLGSTSSLASGSTSISSPPLRVGRTQLNFHNICKNARLYREDVFEFEQLTKEIPNSNHAKWTCKRCNMVVVRVALRLSPPSEDRIWISAAGMLKAHCTREPGKADGWTCIWPVVEPECNARFDGEKRLLQHMKKYHVALGTEGRSSTLHWPADIRCRRPETCGFGAMIGGQVMQNSESCFLVPGSTS